MTRKFTFMILATLFAILGPGAKAWGEIGTIKITRSSFPSGALAYNTTDIWSVTASTGETILGEGDLYSAANQTTMQTKNTGVSTMYHNTVATPGPITKITLKCASGTTRTYTAFMNKTTAITSTSEGTSKGTIAPTAGNTASLSLNVEDGWHYFWLNLAGGASYLDYIEIEYNVESTKTLVSLAVSGNPTKTTYEAGEEFNPAGLVVTGTYDDESQEVITSGITWNVTPAGALTAGTTSISVTATVGEITSEAYVVDGLTVTEFVQTYANTYTSDASLSSVITGSKVKWEGCKVPDGYAAYKFNKGTSINITVPAGTKTVHLHMVAWKGESDAVAVKLGSTNLSPITPTADDGVSGSSATYTIATEPKTENSYYFAIDVNVDEATTLSLTTASSKRAILFGVNFEAAPTKALESIAVKTAPTKTTYNVGETFAPAGLEITATYDDESTEDIAYTGNESKFTFEPNLETALTTANTSVTITYGGKSCNQAITVNLNKLATPTNLQATNVTSASATLTWDAVAGASSYEVNINEQTLTATTNSLSVENLVESTTYTWTVKAIGDNTTYADSEASEESSFTTLAPPTVAYTVAFSGNGHGNPAIGSITEAVAGAGVTLPNCTPNAGYQFVGWATTSEATEADAGEAGDTYHPTANITLYAVYNEVYTINYMVNGANTNPQINVPMGTALVFPEVSAPDADHVFRGWVTEAIQGTTDTEPTYENTTGLTATQNITYYAVFAEQSGTGETTWNKVSTNYTDWNGNEFLIVYESEATTGYVMKEADAVSNYVEATIASGVIASKPEGAMSVIIEKYGTTNDYQLRVVGENPAKYLKGKSDNGLSFDASPQQTTISYDNTNGWLISNNSSWLRYNTTSGQTRFRFYKSTTYTGSSYKSVQLYKKTVGAPTYSNFCTTIVTKVLTSISLSGEYPTAFWKGDAFSHEGMTVTAHYSNADDADVTNKATFSTPDMNTAGDQTVTVTYETQSTTYVITVKTIANTPETAYTVAEAKAIIDANPAELATTEVYVKGTVSDNSGLNDDATITYWLDNKTFEVYHGKNLNNTDFTSVDEISVGDDVVVYGKIKKYYSTYEFDSGNYLVSHVKASTLSINNITVEIGGTITPEITTNVVGDYTISYSVANEDVVKVQDGNLVTVEVGGPVTVTATLTAEGYKDATTTFTVEVIKALNSITVATEPTVTSYKVGDVFDPTGLVITATYSEGEPEDIAYEDNEDKFTFEPSLETELTTDITSVTITYAGKVSTTQEISVRALYTYDITWMANGEQFTATQVTEGNALALPETSPANVGDMKFQGWTATESYFNETTAPEYITNETIPTGNTTYYAVYAKAEEESKIKEYSFAILPSDFNTTSYDANNGSHNFTAICTTDDTKQMTIACTTNQIMQSSKTMQWKKSEGYIYNTTDLGTIKSVEVNSTEGTFTTYYGTSEHPESGTTVGNGFFTVKVGSATGKTSSVVVTFEKEVQVTTYSNFCTTVEPIEEDKTISENTVWEGNITINEHTVTIENNAVLTVNGALINTDPENLIIKDGGQLIVNNTGVLATMKKNINCSTSKASNVNWYTISSPLAANTEFADVTNLIPGNVTDTDYDLYYLDEKNGFWVNSRLENGANPDFTTIDKGRGYIYSKTTAADIAFAGEINVADVECNLTNGALNGFNLVGNPFMQNITLDNVTGVTLAGGFYVLNNDNTWATEPITTGTIAPLQGFLVQATTAGTATISKPTAAPSKGERSEQNTNIEMIVSNSIYRDNAFAMFGEGIGLNKVNHRNTEAPMLYVPQDGEKFAIAFMDENTTVFPLSFKAMTTGKYSVSLKATDNISTLVLVDNMTGEETNMLLEESYKFIGSPADSESRFTVKLKISHNDGQSDNEHFVYQNGSELVINGEGTLQIFDVLGRVVISEEVHGQTVNVGNLSTGAYIVRLTGESVMTQKIVVR